MSLGRITYDPLPAGGERLDEIVAHEVSVHVEAMGHHGYWIGLMLPNGKRLSLAARDVSITENDDWPDAPETRETLSYYCHTNWTTADDVLHQCDVDAEHSRHRCECGRTKEARP